jgi:hypothetical protein
MAYTTIDKSTAYFNTKLYTGNGNAGNAQTGVGFQPDLVWLKSRTNTEYHNFYDSVRGVTKRLSIPPAGAAQSTISGLTAFGTDGFTVGAADTANQNSQNFVAWNWKETATAGFDIVSYTGTGSAKTIAHNLGVIPQMIIVKRYNDGTASWMVYHQNLGSNKYLSLDATSAQATGHWNDTSPTASVFSVGTDQRVNASGASYIAYVFAEKQGYSKFGSYVGNSNADGTFVYTGFKPSFVMLKSSTSIEEWVMFDNKRLGYNPDNNALIVSNSAEATDNDIDFLSNGFKLRRNTGYVNDTGKIFIYMAIGQSIVGSNDVPATAR